MAARWNSFSAFTHDSTKEGALAPFFSMAISENINDLEKAKLSKVGGKAVVDINDVSVLPSAFGERPVSFNRVTVRECV